MKTCYIIITCYIFATSPAQGQGQMNVSAAIAQLHSQDWGARSAAVRSVSQSPELLRAPAIRSELLQLLGRENDFSDRMLASGTAEQYGEAYGEYYADVLGAAFKASDLKNPNDVKILAEGVYNSDSQFARDLADGAGAILVPIAKSLMTSSSHFKQWNGIGLLTRLFEERGINKIPSTTLAGIRQSIVGATASPDSSTRMEAVRAVGRIGTSSDIPLLQRIATADQDVSISADGKTKRFLVREEAAKAVMSIRERPQQ